VRGRQVSGRRGGGARRASGRRGRGGGEKGRGRRRAAGREEDQDGSERWVKEGNPSSIFI